MGDIRAILFDTFGTLVDWRASLIREFAALGDARGIAADWAAVVDGWRQTYVPSMNRVRSGELPWTVLDDLHRTALEPLLAEHGITGVSAADCDRLTQGWHRLQTWPDAVSGLRRLHLHYILAPLSNGNVSLLIDLARFNGLPWDMVFGADVFRHYKPDAQTYLGACGMLSLEPEQVMLCAAHNADLAAAQELGLRTAFVLRRTEYGPGQKDNLHPTGPWDYVATGIEGLADQLGVARR